MGVTVNDVHFMHQPALLLCALGYPANAREEVKKPRPLTSAQGGGGRVMGFSTACWMLAATSTNHSRT